MPPNQAAMTMPPIRVASVILATTAIPVKARLFQTIWGIWDLISKEQADGIS
ncbi:MAG: hypothetical protein L3J16_00390 [Anaerolineales bacterium]|nr:hypothetical protein [Anaerolineales bacterium]